MRIIGISGPVECSGPGGPVQGHLISSRMERHGIEVNTDKKRKGFRRYVAGKWSEDECLIG